jgi:hypothetical protein
VTCRTAVDQVAVERVEPRSLLSDGTVSVPSLPKPRQTVP